MPKLRVVKPKHSLVYAMKLLKNTELENWHHEHLAMTGPDGEPVHLVVHLISGTKEEIRDQLLQSIDAFFDLADEIP